MTLTSGLKDLFTRRPVPPTAAQLTPSTLAAVHLDGRDHRSGRHVILSLRPGSLEPAFDRPNIKDPAHVASRVEEALAKLGVRDGGLSLLVPESVVKSAILSFDELPDSPAERDELFLWRLKKQVPSLPEDVRLAADVLGSGRPRRVFVSVIHRPVLTEYEELFARRGTRVRAVGLATLGLANLLDLPPGANGLLANIEEDCLSLLAIASGEVIFFRSKPFLADSRDARSLARRMDIAAREISTTAAFLEDREKTRVETLWVRAAAGAGEEDSWEALRTRVTLDLQLIEPDRWAGLKAKDARLLAPLIGQWA